MTKSQEMSFYLCLNTKVHYLNKGKGVKVSRSSEPEPSHFLWMSHH